jgi:N-acetylneuraminate synthase/N,N'-diacetyllegionaminate synthase
LATQQKLESPWNGKTGPFLIAEIGGNHEGNFEVAKAMCQLAIDSGTDCIKFQIYHGDTLVSPVESPDRHKHFQKFELTREQHVYLAEMCSEAGLVYCSSVWDLKILEWIDPYLSFYKIGSGDLTAWPILREFARRGKPILLSTGLATMEEVLQAVNQIQRIDERYKRPEMLCLMQCTSMYPIPDHDANLKVMNSFHSLTGLAVGYSDHTAGVTALRTAAAMGAQVLEFHFTDSRDGKIFRDHKVSLVADEVKQLKYEINEIIRLRGTDIKKPTQSETDAQHEISFRRAIYLSRAISDGQTITKDDLCLRRPLVGTDARDVALVIGAKALRDLKPMEAIRPGIDYSCPKDF